MAAILASIDPDSVCDSNYAFKALKRNRLNALFECFCRPSTLPLFMILRVLLNVLRCVNQFFDAGSMSNRIQGRSTGHPKRPPLLDLTNDSYSLVIKAMHVLWNLVSCVRGTCDLGDLLLAVSDGVDATWTKLDLDTRLRVGAVTESACLEYRYARFWGTPFVICEDSVPGAAGACTQRRSGGSDSRQKWLCRSHRCPYAAVHGDRRYRRIGGLVYFLELVALLSVRCS